MRTTPCSGDELEPPGTKLSSIIALGVETPQGFDQKAFTDQKIPKRLCLIRDPASHLPSENCRIQAFRKRFFPKVTLAQWNDWRWQLRNRIATIEGLKRIIRLSEDEQAAMKTEETLLPVAVTPYYASLMDENDPHQAIRRTVVPTTGEYLHASDEAQDPLGEEADSPVPGVVHRYPDRALFLVTEFCSTYCRYCTLSRLVGYWENAIAYIKTTPEIRDVLLFGGDPLILPDDKLEYLLFRLRKISHLEMLRIGTKVPVVLPHRITVSLTWMLKRYHPLWMSIYFTHPDELTSEVQEACTRLANAGIPLGSQTVLFAAILIPAAVRDRVELKNETRLPH